MRSNTMAAGTVAELSDSLLNGRNRYQFLATFLGERAAEWLLKKSIMAPHYLVNISPFVYGIGIGWMSPVMRALQTPDSPLSFEVFVEEVSWIGSLIGIGSLAGNILAGFLQDRIGRKPILLALAVPNMVSRWRQLGFRRTATNWHLFISASGCYPTSHRAWSICI